MYKTTVNFQNKLQTGGVAFVSHFEVSLSSQGTRVTEN